MSNNCIVDFIMMDSIEQAKIEQCCLTCKYSFFSQYQETGLCHNVEMVKGHMYPKVVNEFFICNNWEKKC